MEKAVIAVLEFLLGPLRDRFYASHFERTENDKKTSREALERMKKERSNFERIVEGRGYNSPDHKRAVEVVSYELLSVSMENLRKVRKFRKPSKRVIEQVNQRNAFGVLRELDNLEPRLEKFIRK